jgi:hypothetical protein
LIISGGCGTKEAVKNISDEEALRDRVRAYWDYKVKEEFDKSYEYEYPLFRNQVNMTNYIRSFHTGKAGWSGARIEEVHMEGDTATVDMKIMIKILVSSSKNLEHEALLKEKWVKVDGIWYHIKQDFRERKDVQ